MVARSATPHAITADAVEFIRFCYARRRVGWPELYDEMCAVASRGLFRGWGSDELADARHPLRAVRHAATGGAVNEIVAEDRARAKAAIVSSAKTVAPVACRPCAARLPTTAPSGHRVEEPAAPRRVAVA